MEQQIEIEISKNQDTVKKIIALLNGNRTKYGKRYCPCAIVHNDDHVCQCREFREADIPDGQDEVYCHCGLFRKFIKVD